MKKRIYYRFSGLLSLVMIIVLFISGCSGETTPQVQATETPPPAPTVEVTSEPTPEQVNAEPVADANVLYHDDFTNPATGWVEDKFDNFFIGYHEPEYYHVEVTSPNYKTTVFEPEKKSYGEPDC